MRIISGSHKSKRITAPKYLPVRPTTDMAKEGIFNIFKKLLKEEKKLNLKNIGTFKILNKSKRIGRNPKTGEYHLISERKSLSFKASESLKNKINND